MMAVISVFDSGKCTMFPLKNRLILVAFAVVLCVLECECSIIQRSQWAALPAKTAAATMKKIPTGLVVIHHSDSKSCTTTETCGALVRTFQRHHMNNNKWDDIGYNFVVGEDGNAYVGRGWDKVGAHAPKANSKSVGICVIGNFTDRVPNEAALTAVKDLIAQGVQENHIATNYKVVGHRQVRSTKCPGDALYTEIQSWPHYASKINL